MAKYLVIGTAFTLWSLAASATSFDPSIQMSGAEFSQACTRADESWISFCNGYLQSVVDRLGENDGVCIPQGTSRTDLVTLTERAITSIGQLRGLNAHQAVFVVLRHSYPCS